MMWTWSVMRKVIDCTKHSNNLINKKLKEVSVEEGRIIATELFQILNKRGDGIGLAANQVGIDAQVAVVNVTEPLVLINPQIVHKENEISYFEGCLSYPKKGVNTKRYEIVEVKSDNVESTMRFDGLESICVQHEIDHLNGKTIFDRKIEIGSYKRDTKKIGRNELVTIKKGDAVKVLKYKKVQKMLNDGWEII